MRASEGIVRQAISEGCNLGVYFDHPLEMEVAYCTDPEKVLEVIGAVEAAFLVIRRGEDSGWPSVDQVAYIINSPAVDEDEEVADWCTSQGSIDWVDQWHYRYLLSRKG